MLLLALFQLMASCQSGTVSVSTHDNFALTNAPTYEGSGFLDCSITLSNPKVVVWAIIMMYFATFYCTCHWQSSSSRHERELFPFYRDYAHLWQGKPIRFTITQFTTEGGYDYFTIYKWVET
jgi:hypothetical protein